MWVVFKKTRILLKMHSGQLIAPCQLPGISRSDGEVMLQIHPALAKFIKQIGGARQISAVPGGGQPVPGPADTVSGLQPCRPRRAESSVPGLQSSRAAPLSAVSVRTVSLPRPCPTPQDGVREPGYRRPPDDRALRSGGPCAGISAARQLPGGSGGRQRRGGGGQRHRARDP